MSVLQLGVIAAFAAGVLGILAAQDLFFERARINRNLRSVKAIEVAPADATGHRLATPLPQRLLVPALAAFGRLAGKVTPAGMVERLNRQFAYAGQPAGWDAQRLVALKLVGGTVLGFVGLLLSIASGAGTLRFLFVTGVLAGFGFFMPDAILRSRAEERQKQIRRSLPDALDLLSISVEAGLGFDAAMARVAREVRGPLGQEVNRVLQEMLLGTSRSEAFRDLAERTPLPELKSFVLAMVQADVFGIPVAKVLAVQAQEMRLKRRQAAEERAQKLPVKIMFPLVFCIFPSIFVVLLGPAAIRIFTSLLHLN